MVVDGGSEGGDVPDIPDCMMGGFRLGCDGSRSTQKQV